MPFDACPQGHFYDRSRNAECPYCAAGPEPSPSQPQPVSYSRPFEAAPAAVQDTSDAGPVAGVDGAQGGAPGAIFDPPVGWLVSMEGQAQGQDFTLRSGENAIGSASNMTVALPGEAGISAENHALVVYEKRSNQFLLRPGPGGGLAYRNGESVKTPVRLAAGDRIRVGETTLVFVPLVGEEFRW